jgi:hypothetical protein
VPQRSRTHSSHWCVPTHPASLGVSVLGLAITLPIFLPTSFATIFVVGLREAAEEDWGSVKASERLTCPFGEPSSFGEGHKVSEEMALRKVGVRRVASALAATSLASYLQAG